MPRKPKSQFREEHYLPKRQGRRPKRGAAALPERNPLPAFLSLCLWVAFGVTGLYVLFFSPLLLLTEVQAEGNERIRETELAALYYEATSRPLWHVFSRRNYFWFSEADFAAALRARYPDIEQVTVRTRFPNRITVSLVERDFGVLWCSRGPCYLIDQEGVAWPGQPAEERSREGFKVFRVIDASGLPVTVGDRIFEHAFAAQLRENIFRLESGLSLRFATEAESASRFSDELRFRTEAGWELFLNTRVTPSENEETLRIFFEQEVPFERQGELRYVDLRAENRIYYALKGEEGKEDEKKEEQDGKE